MAKTRPHRKLTAMASVDVADSTRLMTDDEAGALRALALIRRDIAGPLLTLYRGDLFKTMGDGGLIEFASVEDAVAWTLEFQEAMAVRNQNAATPIVFRAAVALADVVIDGDDRHGAAIGFVTHLQEIAPPGGVALTHSARWQLTRGLAQRFTRAETRRVKGVDEPLEVWIHAPGDMPDGVAPPSTVLSTPVAAARADDRPMVVITPFASAGGDPAPAHLVDGLVAEVTRSLAQAGDYAVTACEATRAGGPLDPRFLAMEIGARYVLTGAVRVAGPRVRVSVQLAEAHTRETLWSDRFEGACDDPFALEDHVSAAVAGALHTVVRDAEIARSLRKGDDRLTPQDHILHALPKFWAHQREDNEEAIRHLDAALAEQPRHALALALKGWCLAQKVTYVWSRDVAADSARALACAEEAARLSADDALALTAIGATYTILETDQTRALAFVGRALARDPHLAWAWLRAGYAHAYDGDPREGLRCFERALALSPFDPIRFNIHAGSAICHFLLANYAAAKECAMRSLDHRPGMVWANRLLATAAAHAGDSATATRAVGRLLIENPDMTIATVRAAIHNLKPRDLERYLDGLRMAGLSEGAVAPSKIVDIVARRNARAAGPPALSGARREKTPA